MQSKEPLKMPTMIPSILPIVFLPPDEFEEIRIEESVDADNELPYRVEFDGVFVAYGIRGVMGACRVEPISSTADGRVAQLRKTNRKCDVCENFQPDVEVAVETEDNETLVGYICNECFEQHINAQAKVAHAERQREDADVMRKAREIKKRERSNRRRSRKRN